MTRVLSKVSDIWLIPKQFLRTWILIRHINIELKTKTIFLSHIIIYEVSPNDLLKLRFSSKLTDFYNFKQKLQTEEGLTI